jgi:hypothetical protein
MAAILTNPQTHVCEPNHSCNCYPVGPEPKASCPVHGFPSWPLRCKICGRYMAIVYASRTDDW